MPVIVGNVDLNHSTNPIVSFEIDTAVTCWANSGSQITGNDIYAARFGGINGILPLKLLSFTAVLNGNQTILKWITANELNTASFDVERSANAVHFTKLTNVKAKGATGLANTYSAIDALPLNGVNYYRIKEIDVDDFGTYSQVVSVIKKGSTTITLYPNPALDKVYVNINTRIFKTDNFSLYNASGKLIQQKSVQLNAPNTIVEFNINSLQMEFIL